MRRWGRSTDMILRDFDRAEARATGEISTSDLIWAGIIMANLAWACVFVAGVRAVERRLKR